VTVVIFGHFNRSFYLLTYLLTCGGHYWPCTLATQLLVQASFVRILYVIDKVLIFSQIVKLLFWFSLNVLCAAMPFPPSKSFLKPLIQDRRNLTPCQVSVSLCFLRSTAVHCWVAYRQWCLTVRQSGHILRIRIRVAFQSVMV